MVIFEYVMNFPCRGVPRGPHTPLVELCWSLSGKEEASWQRKGHKAKFTILGKRKEKANLKHLSKRGKIGSTFKFKLGASLRAILGAQ